MEMEIDGPWDENDHEVNSTGSSYNDYSKDRSTIKSYPTSQKIEVVPKYDWELISGLSDEIKKALMLSFAFDWNLWKYVELVLLRDGKVYEYTNSRSKFVSSFGRFLAIVDIKEPFHIYNMDWLWCLFVKPWCPWVACNLFETLAVIFVPKWTPLFFGDGASWTVYEYEPQNMQKILDLLDKENVKKEGTYNLKFNDWLVRSVKTKNINKVPQRLINIALSNQNETYDIRQPWALILVKCLSSTLKIWSSTWEKISLYIDSLDFDSTIICDSNVTDIYVKVAHSGSKIICSQSCRISCSNIDHSDKDLIVERSNGEKWFLIDY